ncbi:hypothetical protein U1Q18_039750 [Sarracenia purpurea var. burkii]
MKWSKIASHLPGRTDNEIKNHWNTHIKKKLKKMGIDPLTHKPLPPPPPPPSDHHQPQDLQSDHHHHQQESPFPSSTCGISELDQYKEIPDTLLEVPIDSLMEVNNGFCTDEVPLIELHEINLVPSRSAPSPASTTTTSSSSSSFCSSFSSSSSSSSSSHDGNSSTILEVEGLDLELPNFELQCDLGFWDDDFTRTLDLIINGDGGDSYSDRNNETIHEEPPTQFSRMVLDLESWKQELF